MAIYSEFSHTKWWFSIVMLVYQRVSIKQLSLRIGLCLSYCFFVVIFSRLFCLIFCLFFAVRSLGFVHLILYIYIYVWNSMQTKWSIRLYNAELWRAKRFLAISVPVLLVARVYNVSCDDGCDNALLRDWHKHCGKQSHLDDRTELWDIW